MSTEAVVNTADDSDSLSPAEEAFFASKGEKAEGLTEQKAEPEKPEKVEAKDAPKEEKKEAKAEGDDPEAEETVELENKGRFVRHGAFHKERMQRKALEQQLAERNAKLAEREQAFARVDERLKLLNEALSPKEQQDDKAPDPEHDPIGFMRWQAKRIEQLEGKTVEVAKTAQQQQEEVNIRNAYVADARAFVGKTPDFTEAYQFLLQGRDLELQAYGITDAQERAKIIQDEERNLVARALKDNASPSERVYNLAKARGYAKKAEAKPEPDKKAEEQIDTIARGQAASKTLSSAGGSPTEVLTAEALANMSEEEFQAWMAKTPRSQQRAIFGG